MPTCGRRWAGSPGRARWTTSWSARRAGSSPSTRRSLRPLAPPAHELEVLVVVAVVAVLGDEHAAREARAEGALGHVEAVRVGHRVDPGRRLHPERPHVGVAPAAAVDREAVVPLARGDEVAGAARAGRDGEPLHVSFEMPAGARVVDQRAARART